MAFYRKTKSKLNDLWYPKAITVGKPVTTDQVADRLAILSTVTRGDTYAVLKNLGGVMADYMAQGLTVKIEGVGTFYYTAATNKQGVVTPEEVSASQINNVRVRFIPEVGRSSNNKIVTRSLVDTNISWTDVETLMPSAKTETGGGDDGGADGGTSGDGGQEENPFG